MQFARRVVEHAVEQLAFLPAFQLIHRLQAQGVRNVGC